MVWFHLVRRRLERFDLVRFHLVRFHLVRFHLVRFHLVRFHLVRFHLVGSNLERFHLVGSNLVRIDLVRLHLERSQLDRPDLGPRQAYPLISISKPNRDSDPQGSVFRCVPPVGVWGRPCHNLNVINADVSNQPQSQPPTTNNQRTVAVTLAAALIFSFAVSAFLYSQVRATEARIEDLTAELEEVESGAAYALAQLGVFSNAIGDLGPSTTGAIDEAIVGLDQFAVSTIEVLIDVDETVTIDTDFVFAQEIVVPIRTEVPIQQTFDTTITIDGPLGTEIPLDISVPVDLIIPVDVDVPIAVNETIPVSADIPIALAVPVRIDVAGTELAVFAESLRDGLIALRDALAQLDG